MNHEYPILEYDAARKAYIEPGSLLKQIDMPEHVVVCFFQDVITQLSQQETFSVIYHLRSEVGKHPIYQVVVDGKKLAVVHPGMGGPMAAMILEEMIALGGRKFIAIGGAGVLVPEIAVGHLVVPVSAVRDEGSSYHYLPPGREVAPDPRSVAAIEATLKEEGLDYLTGKTWTTDAIFRETVDKVNRRKDEGCLVVEMESATFFAVAQFREVQFGQILYGGDDLSGEKWDARRSWTRHQIRETLF